MRPLLLGLLLLWYAPAEAADAITRTFKLENQRIRCSVQVKAGVLSSDRVEMAGARTGSKQRPSLETDAGFAVDLMYTDWRAPGKQNNADNPVMLRAKDFRLAGFREETTGNSRMLSLSFAGVDNPLQLSVTYRLDNGSTTVRRKIAVRDTVSKVHFLRWLWPRRGTVSGVDSLVNAGQFGQPVALLSRSRGAFFGLEYPASENRYSREEGLECGQEFGARIGDAWIESEWVAEGLTPDTDVKKAFFAYLDEIRVAPLRPYTLYNSWYDLRSPEYPKIPPENRMSETSAMKMTRLLRTNMIDRYGINLDAFVLDDGWDVYDSDWVLRPDAWPRGLKPLATALAETRTSLGIWLGPTGGYSFRDRRLAWMTGHGYESVGGQLCVGGTRYGALLKRRVHDFAAKDGVGYFKWDGIQFSCSQPDHGHPTDVYSRRAVLESVIGMVDTVRHANPGMFLNITSGTWLSPWWLKYANTIWMDGQDYGYADVPSISKRDAAITYRDFVLYEDFHIKGLWFPVSNLMTHGIIKGKIQLLGSPEEPLDKFTDDALLYCARGVSMYELYISPDIMSGGEWGAIARSLAWARDRFPVLMHTAMIGGNPLEREAYGYAHFNGRRGIIAARNPVVAPAVLGAKLSRSEGLDASADSLVLERVYPTRWVSPHLYRSGESVKLPLEGFETAVYEFYPLAEAEGPLLAGAVFDTIPSPAGTVGLRIHSISPGARLLNPETVAGLRVDGKNVAPAAFAPRAGTERPMARGSALEVTGPGAFRTGVGVDSGATGGMLAILCAPDTSVHDEVPPTLAVTIDGTPAQARSEQEEGRSRWFTVPLVPGKHIVEVGVKANPKESLKAGRGAWRGKVSLWGIAMVHPAGQEVVVTVKKPAAHRVMPPQAWGTGLVRKSILLGETAIVLTAQ